MNPQGLCIPLIVVLTVTGIAASPEFGSNDSGLLHRWPKSSNATCSG